MIMVTKKGLEKDQELANKIDKAIFQDFRAVPRKQHSGNCHMFKRSHDSGI